MKSEKSMNRNIAPIGDALKIKTKIKLMIMTIVVRGSKLKYRVSLSVNFFFFFLKETTEVYNILGIPYTFSKWDEYFKVLTLTAKIKS